MEKSEFLMLQLLVSVTLPGKNKQLFYSIFLTANFLSFKVFRILFWYMTAVRMLPLISI